PGTIAPPAAIPPRRASPPEAGLDVAVGLADEPGERGGVDLDARPELAVPAERAGPLQQARRVHQQGTEEEADVDVALEGVDVGEGRVAHAGGRAAVVHQLAHIAAALAHALEPGLNEGAQIGSLRAQPRVDLGIVLHRGGEAKDVVAGHLATSRRARATVSARSAGPPPPRRAPAGPR